MSALGVTVGTIDKGHAAQLRVSLTSWRDKHRVDLRECTATVPGIYFPTSNGVTLDIAKLPELIEVLLSAEVEARTRGLIGEKAVAA